MPTLSYAQLAAAAEPGGASALSLVTQLAPAGGPHAGVVPARHARQIRYVDGEPAVAVVIDAKQRQLGRVEAAILQGMHDDHPLLGRVPRMQVCYDAGDAGRAVCTDLELPHRAFDGHIRAGTVAGTPVAADPTYRAVLDSSAANSRALLELSPGSVVFGSFDSSRTPGRVRYHGALAGEIIGVLADQRDNPPRELGDLDDSGASPGVVACRRIIRTQVLSFAALRQLRFDSGPAGDASCRALLAAYALAGLVRANAELAVRADCDLVETAPTSVRLDARNGDFVALAAPSIAEADEVLERALDEAKREADIHWRGQVFEITGDPATTP